MARVEKIYDDHTGQEISYPFITVRSIRVELSPTEYVWLGDGDIHTFKNGQTFGAWVEVRLRDMLEQEGVVPSINVGEERV